MYHLIMILESDTNKDIHIIESEVDKNVHL